MWDWISCLSVSNAQGRPLALVTVTSCTGSTPREIGAKMIVYSDSQFEGTIGGGHLEELAIQDAVACLVEGKSKTFRYPLGAKTGQCCGGIMEILIEALNCGPVLYVFGAGHVGQAVSRILMGTPFRVHVIDEREEWIRQLPGGVVPHVEEWDDFIQEAVWDKQKTFVVIMTHRHDLDQDILQRLLEFPMRYLGLIGSSSKWERFQQRLTARGVEQSSLDRVKCPIGWDTGGKAPQEVAISLAAELLAIHYGKNSLSA